MEITTEVIDEMKTDNRHVLEDKINPMMLSLVIKCVYKFLGLKDIKNCRLVCREWNVNSKLVIGDRSKIKLTLSKDDDTISKFLEFLDTTKINFHSFEFEMLTWKVNKLNEFFESQLENIKELYLGFIVLEDNGQNNTGKHNITPWISRSLMTKPNTKYNTKLSISCLPILNVAGFIDFYVAKADLLVSVSALVYIKDIEFDHVLVNVDNVDGIKMSPIKLNLNKVKFFLNEEELTTICINSFVDFSKCTSVFLTSGYQQVRNLGRSTNITLDLSGDEKSVDIDRLKLKDVTVINWTNSLWKVNELKMIRVPFLEISGMEIVHLNFLDSHIDFSCLPQSIKTLMVRIKSSNTVVRCSHPIYLPNLKFLYLEFRSPEHFSVLSYFNCPKLVDLHLNGGYLGDDNILVKFDWIPKTIRRLTLIEMETVWEEIGQELLLLDQLVFQDCIFRNVNRNCIDNIQVKDIILRFSSSRKPTVKAAFPFLDILKYFNQSKRQPERLLVGSLDLDGESALDNYVDKIAKYYVFENQRGMAIDKNYFDHLGYTYMT